MELPFLSDKVGDSVAFSKDALLGLWSMAGEVCAFFGVLPFILGEGLVLDGLFESKYVSPASIDSCSGEVTKLKGRESRFE